MYMKQAYTIRSSDMNIDEYLVLLEREIKTNVNNKAEARHIMHLASVLRSSLPSLACSLLDVCYSQYERLMDLEAKYSICLNDNSILEKTIADLQKEYGLSGRDIHNAIAHNGKSPVEKKVSALEVAVLLNAGWTDQRIQDEYEISRTTLYRRKRDIERMGGVKKVCENVTSI